MKIRYAQIDVDGGLSFAEAEGFISDWLNPIVGPEGWDRVRLPARWSMAGFVNDCGLLFPDRYPRNVVGSVVASGLGAKPFPLPGKVVITGWDASATMRGDYEVRPLQEDQEQIIAQIHGDARRALGMDPDPLDPAVNPLTEWNIKAREFAEFVKSSPTPGWTILTDSAEVEAALRQMGRVDL